jgi:hypothetical protein
MKFRNVRVALMFSLIASILTIAFILPTNAAPAFHLAFVSGRAPADAVRGQLITSGRFNQAANPVQVELLNSANQRVTNFPVTITLVIGTNPTGAPNPEAAAQTVQGVATFNSGLSIGTTNVAEFTSYTLVPRTTDGSIVGTDSPGFDIWESATLCTSGNCVLNQPTVDDPIPDTYTAFNASPNSSLTASTFSTEDSALDCAGYDELTGFVVWHEYTGSGSVFVVIHTARSEMKLSASNGQTSVELCVGLSDNWSAKGGTTVGPDGLFVGLAPKCPKKAPQNAAPCITRQYGDGNGGNYTEAWLPGGDPPRRT